MRRERPAIVRRALATMALGALAACTAAEPAPPAYAVTDSAGVRLVHNDGDPARLDTPRESLVETLRVGVVDGEPAYQFDGVHDLAVAGDGRLFVVNGGTSTVRVFDREGRFLREFGGRGGGPGELRMLAAVALHGDTVVAMDYARTALFDTLGAFRAQWDTRRPMPVRLYPGGIPRLALLGHSPVGWLGHVVRTDPARRSEPGRRYQDTVTVLRVDVATGDSLGVAYRLPGRWAVGMPRGAAGGEMARLPRLWETTVAGGMGPDGRVYFSDGERYAVEVRDTTGRLLRRITRAHQPVALDAGQVEAFRARVRAHLDTTIREARRREAELRRIVDELPALGHPAVLSPIGALRPTADGWLWVRRADVGVDPPAAAFARLYRGGGDGPGEQWDRFDPEGRFVGAVRLPPRFSPRAFTRDAVVGVQRDASDVEHVVRLRLAPAGGG